MGLTCKDCCYVRVRQSWNLSNDGLHPGKRYTCLASGRVTNPLYKAGGCPLFVKVHGKIQRARKAGR